MNCWLESLPLSCAITVNSILESKMNLETLEDGVRLVDYLEIPQTVKNTMMKMLEGNRVEKSFHQHRHYD